MEKVTVFLRNALFCTPGEDSHVPRGTSILEGRVVERMSGCITLAAERLLDDEGRELCTSDLSLEIPWLKIDHLLIHGD